MSKKRPYFEDSPISITAVLIVVVMLMIMVVVDALPERHKTYATTPGQLRGAIRHCTMELDGTAKYSGDKVQGWVVICTYRD